MVTRQVLTIALVELSVVCALLMFRIAVRRNEPKLGYALLGLLFGPLAFYLVPPQPRVAARKR